MMDYLSKWPEAYPLYNKSAKEVAERLADTIYRYGPPDIIVSDCGWEFNSKITDQLMIDYNIKHIKTAPYHPQANGLVENFNQTLKSMINKTVNESGSDWDKKLPKALFAYRTSKHHSSKFTPFEAMYIRKPVLPNEASIGPVSTLPEENISMETIDKLQEKRSEIENIIKENIGQAQKRQKEAYDKRHNVESSDNIFNINQLVLLKNFRRKHGMGTVNQDRYKGPYTIIKKCGKGNFLLIDNDTGKSLGPYNQKSLKKWNEPIEQQAHLEVDENNNSQGSESEMQKFERQHCCESNEIITEAVVHCEVNQPSEIMSDNENSYPPSAQSNQENSASFDLFSDTSLIDIFRIVRRKK